MKKVEFPKVVRVGQTKATIYKTPSHGCDSFTVVWFEGAVRKRKAFATAGAAELHASSMVNSLSRGEAEIIQLSGEDRLSFVRAKSALAEFNLSLDSIAFEYRDAKRIANGISLVDIAQYYAQHKLRDLPNKTVSEVLAEMLKAKRDEGLSDLYLRDLKIRGGKFAKDFQCNLASVQMDKIRDWLQAMPVANRSRNNCRLAVQTLFAFAKSRKYLPADWQEFKSIPLWKIKSEPVEIFTPEELEKLLSLANDNLIPFLTIGAFAGLRSAEIERLDWVKINLESDFITVDASIAKTNSRRLIPIQPNLKAWLKPHAKPQGKVVDLVGISSAIYRLIDNTRPNDPDNPKSKLKPSVEWRRNALRHSYCSYRLAQIKNTAEVALEAGNSPQMIFQHSMILLTDHAQPHCFSVDLILRNLPPQDSFVVEWKYPVMVERDDLEPEGEEDAREDERTRQILGLLQDEPMTTGKWEEEAIAAGIPHATFFRIKTKLQDGGHIIRDRSDRTWSLPAKPAKPK